MTPTATHSATVHAAGTSDASEVHRRTLPAALIGAMLLVGASPAPAMDLLEAYRLALAHDSQLASAQAAHDAGVEALPQAQAALGPSLTAGLAAGWLRARPPGLPDTIGTTVEGSLTGVLPLYRPADQVALEQAKARNPGIEAQLRGARSDGVIRVAQAYLNALLAQDTLESTLKQKEALEQQLRQSERQYQIGTGTITDVADARARYDLIKATELQTRSSLEIASLGLEVLTGVAVDRLAPLAFSSAATDLARQDIQSWTETAVETSPTVAVAKALTAAQQLEIERARAAWKPTIDLALSIAATRFSQPSLDLTQTNGRTAEVSVQLTWQIWEAGLRASRLRQAQALALQAEQELLTAQRTASLNTRQAYLALLSSEGQVAAFEQAVTSSQVSLDASQRGSEVGSRTAVDVLNARQQLFQARNQLTTARYAMLLSFLQLKAAAGLLGEEDLRFISGRG